VQVRAWGLLPVDPLTGWWSVTCLPPLRAHPHWSRPPPQVQNALFEPPAFQPSKLSVEYLPGADARGPAPPCARRYTLTHNDLTGALQLSIGAEFNVRQVKGFYTRVLRDEVVAEWRFGGGGEASQQQQQLEQRRAPGSESEEAGVSGSFDGVDSTSSGSSSSGSSNGTTSSSGSLAGLDRPSLHVFCHVSGEESWLAPPALRNFIFRREMTLVSRIGGGTTEVLFGD
jgi:hypothetical protein